MTSCGTYDPAPLLAIARNTAFRHPGVFEEQTGAGVHWADPCPQPQIQSIAELLDLSPDTVTRYMRGGLLRREAADHAAVRLGLHPCLIWPEWFSS